MWIFQELMLAKPGKLLFLTPVEPHFITGDDLRLALRIFDLSGHHFHQQADPDYITEDMMEHLLAFGDLGSACKYINRRLTIRSRLHERGVSHADRASLCVLSAFGHNTQASNPLDYYYSLLVVSQLSLIPNYHSTNQVESVCVEFVRAYLDATSGSSNALLFLHDALGSDAKAHRLPSWAPRYHLRSRDPDFHGRRFDYGAGAYRGVFEHAPGIGGIRARVEGLKLLAEGVRVGSVNLVVDQIPAATNAYLSDFERRNNGHYVTGISCSTAYFGTLMMDETVEHGIWKRRITKRIFSGFSDHDCVREKNSWRFLKDTNLHCLHEALSHSESGDVAGTSEWSRTLSAHASIRARRLFEFEGGYIGLALHDVGVGDVVCVLNGSQYPVILRPLSHDHFEFVGTYFVIGLMKGEAKAFLRTGRRVFTIV